MKHLITTLLLSIIASTVAFTPVNAHQPMITEGHETIVSEPEISKAYYGELNGKSDTYIIDSKSPFDLYVNILVPFKEDSRKDITVQIHKNGIQTVLLDGNKFEWKKFYEPFGADNYWMGPEYRLAAQAGKYEIIVSSTNNDSKYTLAIGEIEVFDRKTGIDALTTIPKLKKSFFEESPIGFIVSPFGWGLILAMYILGALFGLIYRSLLRRVAKTSSRKVSKNIGKPGRIIRLLIGIVLLVWAITTTWNPILLFFSGFALFESLFSWCGFYAAIGKNTCTL